MDGPSQVSATTSAPKARTTERRVVSLVAAAGGVFGVVRAIDQSRYDPPLAWMVLAAVAIVLFIVAFFCWPKGRRRENRN
jgi:hypothetical protein